MRYYRTNSGVVSTVGSLPFDEISKDEFDAKIKEVEDSMNTNTPDPEPTNEERIAALEDGQATLSDELAAAKILLGLED